MRSTLCKITDRPGVQVVLLFLALWGLPALLFLIAEVVY